MSHVAEVEVEVKDLECLKKAAERLGLEFMEGQTTYKWYGRHVGDYPLPAGFSKEEMGKCTHALRIKGQPKAYEIGITARRDGKKGYTLLWDFWQGGYGLKAAIGNNGDKLKQAYAVEVAIKQARRQGYRVKEHLREDGSIRLTASN